MKPQTKHTPTPWEIHNHVIYTKNEALKIFHNDGINNLESNAKFIVKACNSHDELLEACKLSLINIEENWKDKSNVIIALKQAIAKAEGEK